MSEWGFHPNNLDELTEYVERRVSDSNKAETTAAGYEEAAKVLSDVAMAAFNYAAGQTGVTNFQSSWAALQIVKTINGYDGPFGIIKADEALFPQYNVRLRAEQLIEGWQPWLKQKAIERLQEGTSGVHPRVWKHWLELAGDDVPEGTPTVEDVERIYEEHMAEVRREIKAERAARG